MQRTPTYQAHGIIMEILISRRRLHTTAMVNCHSNLASMNHMGTSFLQERSMRPTGKLRAIFPLTPRRLSGGIRPGSGQSKATGIRTLQEPGTEMANRINQLTYIKMVANSRLHTRIIDPMVISQAAQAFTLLTGRPQDASPAMGNLWYGIIRPGQDALLVLAIVDQTEAIHQVDLEVGVSFQTMAET